MQGAANSVEPVGEDLIRRRALRGIGRFKFPLVYGYLPGVRVVREYSAAAAAMLGIAPQYVAALVSIQQEIIPIKPARARVKREAEARVRAHAVLYALAPFRPYSELCIAHAPAAVYIQRYPFALRYRAEGEPIPQLPRIVRGE